MSVDLLINKGRCQLRSIKIIALDSTYSVDAFVELDTQNGSISTSNFRIDAEQFAALQTFMGTLGFKLLTCKEWLELRKLESQEES